MKRTQHRLKKDYDRLYREPKHLFGPGPDSCGLDTMLFPNGERQIWIRGSGRSEGMGFRLTASEGPAGVTLTVQKLGVALSGDPLMTVRAVGLDYQPLTSQPVDGAREVTLTFYRQDARSQAFKRWYDGQETEEDVRVLGPEYAAARAGARWDSEER